MSLERLLRLIAGFFVMLSVALGYWVHPAWYWFTGFVGLNLFQSAFTNWCPMMVLLKALGSNPAKARPSRLLPKWREGNGAARYNEAWPGRVSHALVDSLFCPLFRPDALGPAASRCTDVKYRLVRRRVST